MYLSNYQLGVPFGAPFKLVPFPAAAAVLGGAQLATGLIGSIFGRKNNQSNVAAQQAANEANLQMTRETNAANQQINADNIAAQFQLQQQQNAWNSETAQAARLRAAGLNPANIGLGNGSTSSSLGVPSSIAEQAGHVDPVLSNSDTYINPLMESFSSAASTFADFNKGMSDQLGNQYSSATMSSRIAQAQQELQRTYAEIDLVKATKAEKDKMRSVLEEQWRQLQLDNQLNSNTMVDMEEARGLQNQLLKNQINQSFEQAKLFAEQQITEQFNRFLGAEANSRANRISVAEIKNLTAAAFMYSQQGNVSEQTWKELRNTFRERLNGLRSNNKLTDEQRLTLNAQQGYFDSMIDELSERARSEKLENDHYWLNKSMQIANTYFNGVGAASGVAMSILNPWSMFMRGTSSHQVTPPLPSSSTKYVTPTNTPMTPAEREAADRAMDDFFKHHRF